MKKKSGLGKGLHELLAASLGDEYVSTLEEDNYPTKKQSEPSEMSSRESLARLPIHRIHKSPYQPRTEMDPTSLEELSQSIKSQGVIQPIVVRSKGNDQFELVAGERRWRAAQMAGLEEIPAVVKVLTDEAAFAIALIENMQRENLNPIDEARALKRLADEFSCTHQEVADVVGKSRAAVTNLMRLLDLNADVQLMLEHGDIEMGHAKALLGLTGKMQSDAARMVVTRSMSVRETEQLVKKLKNSDTLDKPSSVEDDPNIMHLKTQLSEILGAFVEIKHGEHGKGSVLIRYNSLDELEGILSHIK